jgi:hypothetical protein
MNIISKEIPSNYVIQRLFMLAIMEALCYGCILLQLISIECIVLSR